MVSMIAPVHLIALAISVVYLSANNQHVETLCVSVTSPEDNNQLYSINFTRIIDSISIRRIRNLKTRAFELFLNTYNKTYETKRELAKRSRLYLSRLNVINKWNQKYEEGIVSYKLRANHFADWTKQELAKAMGSSSKVDENLDNFANLSSIDNQQASFDLVSDTNLRANYGRSSSGYRAISLPATRDWSNSGCLVGVRDQQKCESCYAFATIDLVATMHCLDNNKGSQTKLENKSKMTPRSVQQIIDCAPRKREYANTIRGCNGGQPMKVLEYLRRYNLELASEDIYPYKAKQGSCRIMQRTKRVPRSTTLSNATQTLTSAGDLLLQIDYKHFNYRRLSSESQIMEHVANNGPVVGSMRVIDKFVSYDSGLFDDQPNNKCQRSGYNHIVLIVGYGHDAKAKKNYWIIKNSWGDDWGEKGFARIVRGKSVCKIGNWGLGIKLTSG